jgi:hypothetical protein
MELFIIALVAAVVPVVAALQGQGSRGFCLALMVVGALAGACSLTMTPRPEEFAATEASGDDGEIVDAALFRDHGDQAAAGAFGMSAGGLMGAVLFRPLQPALDTSQGPTPRRARRPRELDESG